MPSFDDDFVPVVGGVELPGSQVRRGIVGLESSGVQTDLDRDILRLLALHPRLRVRFRKRNLAAMDALTKQTLLEDMRDMLGIRPLRTPGP
jgi:hypothetical protein